MLFLSLICKVILPFKNFILLLSAYYLVQFPLLNFSFLWYKNWNHDEWLSMVMLYHGIHNYIQSKFRTIFNETSYILFFLLVLSKEEHLALPNVLYLKCAILERKWRKFDNLLMIFSLNWPLLCNSPPWLPLIALEMNGN